MKYQCMLIIDEKGLQAISESEAQALDATAPPAANRTGRLDGRMPARVIRKSDAYAPEYALKRIEQKGGWKSFVARQNCDKEPEYGRYDLSSRH